MTVPYHLVTHALIGAEPPVVWECLSDVERWPSWWRWLRRVELVEEGDEDGVGAVFTQSITSPLLYGFTWHARIDRVFEPSLIELASWGALEGRGRFHLCPEGEGRTHFSFTWLVTTGKRWMNLVAPIARSAFVWSHDRLMADFARGLARVAGAPLLGVGHRSLRPGDDGFFEMPSLSEEDDRRHPDQQGVDGEGHQADPT